MKISFRNRMLLTIGFSCVICTATAIFVASNRIEDSGEQALIEKSRAILSRLKVGASYVAAMGTLDGVIQETIEKFPHGEVDSQQKLKVLKSVPIFAAFKIGETGAAEENYQFRVASDEPRNKDNAATNEEKLVIGKFRSDPKLNELVEINKELELVRVYRPVRISESQNCLVCHGHPSTSPWKNGKDILGYQMENMKDGDFKGMFTIISSLKPIKAQTKQATMNIVLWGSVFMIFALLIGFLIVKGPVAGLKNVAEHLSESAETLTAESSEISSVSQTLSASSTESASSLEETVASIEELSSMVKLNADNAKQAAIISQEGTQEALMGEKEMEKLIQSMNDIGESSKKIEEIINVIDDIAFQTNLLALNAAVEAARAGEQGKGFAVVAEAVRSLAQRSGSAAKDITTLIQESVSKIENGTKTADASALVLKQIVSSVKKVSDINGEIASASQEQATGISQISLAMNQLDKSTQQNANSSEQASQSAIKMADQAHKLKSLVSDLFEVVDGKQQNSTSQPGVEKHNVIPFSKGHNVAAENTDQTQFKNS